MSQYRSKTQLEHTLLDVEKKEFNYLLMQKKNLIVR